VVAGPPVVAGAPVVLAIDVVPLAMELAVEVTVSVVASDPTVLFASPGVDDDEHPLIGKLSGRTLSQWNNAR